MNRMESVWNWLARAPQTLQTHCQILFLFSTFRLHQKCCTIVDVRFSINWWPLQLMGSMGTLLCYSRISFVHTLPPSALYRYRVCVFHSVSARDVSPDLQREHCTAMKMLKWFRFSLVNSRSRETLRWSHAVSNCLCFFYNYIFH